MLKSSKVVKVTGVVSSHSFKSRASIDSQLVQNIVAKVKASVIQVRLKLMSIKYTIDMNQMIFQIQSRQF